MAQIPERLTLTPEDLHLNIIYLKDGQRCFTCRRDCAVQTGNWITDALIQVLVGADLNGVAVGGDCLGAIAKTVAGVEGRAVVIDGLVVVSVHHEGPRLLLQEGEQEGAEGCLSVPGKWGMVTRPYRVKVRNSGVPMKTIRTGYASSPWAFSCSAK